MVDLGPTTSRVKANKAVKLLSSEKMEGNRISAVVKTPFFGG